MIKMPDLSELKKSVNLQNIMDNVKSAIETVSTPKAPPTNDELATKFAEITRLMGELFDMNAQQTRAIANIKSKIQMLDKDIQIVKSLAVGANGNAHPVDTIKSAGTTGNGPTETTRPVDTKIVSEETQKNKNDLL